MDRVSSRSDVVFTTVALGEADLMKVCCKPSTPPTLVVRLGIRGVSRIADDDFIESGIGGAPSSNWRPASGDLVSSSNAPCGV
mmetsp:Transcript_3926/g.11143  ORF Transcript_3926/g.11143 Transcript_3926/m.11143 type:complete len:83 (+) Transcript_3926:3179-3427(+)